MKVKKLDLSGVKAFLFNKGERVAVVVCAALAVLFMGIGIKNATSAMKPFDQEFKKAAANINNRISDNRPPTKPKDVEAPRGWQQVAENFPDHQPLIVVSPGGDESKRRRPTILPINDDPKHIQIAFLRGAYYSFEIDKTKETVMSYGGNQAAAAGPTNPAAGLTKNMRPARLAIVSAVFPMKEQVAEYRKQLRYAPDVDLKPEDLPYPVGLNVWRIEILPDGKDGEAQPLYLYNPAEEKLEVAERLKNLYREAYIDDETPKAFGAQIIHGLITPLPLLANIHYPKTSLANIKVGDEAPKQPRFRNGRGSRQAVKSWQKQNPGGAAGASAPPPAVPVAWSKLNSPVLQDKFAGKIDYFDATGELLPDDTLNPAIQPPGLGRQSITRRPPRTGVGKGGGTLSKDEIVDALVRFIDVDLEIGKTYRYAFQVRMANPNFDKREDVLYQALAEDKELVSQPSITPPITVSDEYYWYAVDKQPDNPGITGGSDTKPARPDKGETTVQVHRWVGKIANGDKTVADWAIAERLLIRRGGPVGRNHVMVEVPVYDKTRDTLEIGFEPQPIDLKRKSQRASTGLPINFILEKDANSPPLLVDFEGGERKNAKVGTVTIAKDESAVDVLVLTPDNKLVIRNSRLDSDPEYPPARERIERYETWLNTIRDLRDAAPAPGAGKKR